MCGAREIYNCILIRRCRYSLLSERGGRKSMHASFVSKNRNEHYTICIGASVVCVFVVWLIRFSGFNLWSSVSCADCQKVNYVYSRWMLLLLFCIECTCELFSNDCAPSLWRLIYTCLRYILDAYYSFFFQFRFYRYEYDSVCTMYMYGNCNRPNLNGFQSQ